MSSKEFEDAFCHDGHAIIQCGCGLVHTAPDFYAHVFEDYDEKQKQQFRDERADGLVRDHACSSVRDFTFQNEGYVIGCECEKDSEVEELFLQHEDDLADFLIAIKSKRIGDLHNELEKEKEYRNKFKTIDRT